MTRLPGGRRLFVPLSVGEAAGRRSRECGGGRCPPQISHSRDQLGGPERKKNSSAPAPGSQLSP
ncbi:MAG: hypothetical protein J7M32_03430 [Deltaproteobacteria bacterium]|nr:hypothetical protein [Deltaproteobacteria bacterium]